MSGVIYECLCSEKPEGSAIKLPKYFSKFFSCKSGDKPATAFKRGGVHQGIHRRLALRTVDRILSFTVFAFPEKYAFVFKIFIRRRSFLQFFCEVVNLPFKLGVLCLQIHDFLLQGLDLIFKQEQSLLEDSSRPVLGNDVVKQFHKAHKNLPKIAGAEQPEKGDIPS